MCGNDCAVEQETDFPQQNLPHKMFVRFLEEKGEDRIEAMDQSDLKQVREGTYAYQCHEGGEEPLPC